VSYNGRIVVDMDSHVREYEDLDRTYREHIDPAYREPFDELSGAVAKHRDAGLSTMLFMNPYAVLEPSDETRPLGVYDHFGNARGRAAVRTKAEGRISAKREPVPREVHWDPSIRLRDMERADIDVSVMFPSHATSFCTLRDVGFESALHNAYHRYMSNYCADSGGKLRWVAIATMRDIGATVENLTYWAEEDMNLVGVLVPPSCPDGRLLDNPALHPLFQRAQDLDLPVLVHGGVLRPPYTAGATELDNSGFLIRAMYQPWSGMMAVGALIGGGVFDLFDQLRVGVFETGAGWMPWLIEALDGSYDGRGHLTPLLGRLPSEVVAEGRLFHAAEGADRQLPHCIEELGDDMWLFSTDYPHTGSPWPFGVSEVTDRSNLSEEAKRKILGANALRLCTRITA
jgi:predicted TIM-barrel fold metal-dependent hydrolase